MIYFTSISNLDQRESCPTPGIDFFWDFRDVLTAIATNGHQRASELKFRLEVNLCDEDWNLNRRIYELALACFDQDYKSALEPMLLDAGWIFVDTERASDNSERRVFVPEWSKCKKFYVSAEIRPTIHPRDIPKCPGVEDEDYFCTKARMISYLNVI